jgi:outer membrane biosynthesis protein TonB
MRRGLIISSALHLLILFWAVAVFPSARDKLPVKPTPLPVDLVSQAEFTKIKAGQRKVTLEKAKSEKKPEPAKKKLKKKPKLVKVKSVKAPAPKPKKTVKAEPKPKPKPKPKKQVKKAKPKPKKHVKKTKPKPKKVAAKAKPARKKKKNFDPDKIAALLNKVPDAGAKTTASKSAKKKPKPAKGRSDGRDLAMTFNEIDALRARISQCWNPPVGGLGADAIKVKLRLRLREDGALSREPEVVNRAGSPYFRAAADAAVRAVMLCQPYNLPARKYALWRDMILNFDPREMFGG